MPASDCGGVIHVHSQHYSCTTSAKFMPPAKNGHIDGGARLLIIRPRNRRRNCFPMRNDIFWHIVLLRDICIPDLAFSTPIIPELCTLRNTGFECGLLVSMLYRSERFQCSSLTGAQRGTLGLRPFVYLNADSCCRCSGFFSLPDEPIP